MTGLILLAALAIAVVTLLELSHRRHTTPFADPRRADRTIDDRDPVRSKLDLLALAARAEPLTHKPFKAADTTARHSPALPAAG